MHLVYSLLMWLLVHSVLFCFRVFSHGIVLPSVPGLWLVHLASPAPSSNGCGAGTGRKRTVLACLLVRAAHSSALCSSTLITVQPPPLPPALLSAWSLLQQDPLSPVEGQQITLGSSVPCSVRDSLRRALPSLLGEQEQEATESSLRLMNCILRSLNPPYLGTGEIREGL